ncbi:hypothetical protein LWI28_002288 [Acer negundo]|uniref:Uncharacterized protein n=1 Tax=Acer negundo TaxID=4023 RepID=A0AAD5NR83_ACENE|nr:hypothetical protein LWI28_002288 [Acer negundo]
MEVDLVCVCVCENGLKKMEIEVGDDMDNGHAIDGDVKKMVEMEVEYGDTCEMVMTPPSIFASPITWAAKQQCRSKIPTTINCRRGLDITPLEARFEIAVTCPIAILIFV